MAPNQSPDELTDTPLSGASPLPHLDRSLTVRWRSAVRPPREQAPSPQVQRHTQNCVDTEARMAPNQSPDELTDTPLSGASPLPHLDRSLTVRWRSAVRPPREQAPSPQVQRHTQNCVGTEASMALNQSPDELTDTPLSGASPLPHLDRSLTVRWRSAVRPPREQAPLPHF